MEGEEGKAEGGVFLLIQHVSDTDVVGNHGRNDTDDTASLGRCFTGIEGTSSEDGKGCGEEEEQGDEADTLAQAYDAISKAA